MKYENIRYFLRFHAEKCRFFIAVFALSLATVAHADVANAFTQNVPNNSSKVRRSTEVTQGVPLLFNALTTFKELFLQSEVSGVFGSLAMRPTTMKADVAPVVWTMPDESRRRTEALSDPVPAYFPFEELWHTVQKHEDRERIDDMYKYPLGFLERLNPGVRLDQIKPGDRLLVWRRSEYPSQSRGKAHRGRLLYGEPLRQTDASILLYQHRVFGTTHTVATVQSVLDAYAQHFPKTHPILIGDISYRGGGHIKPHKSHRTGRDIDIAYPNIVAPTHYRRFMHTRTNNLDVEKTLWLFKRFIDTGYVEYIFVDRRLQRLLVKEAKRQGAPDAWIAAVFQYHGRPNAIIRHARGHRNHFHIRFRCTLGDTNCRDSFRERRRAEERERLLAAEAAEHSL